MKVSLGAAALHDVDAHNRAQSDTQEETNKNGLD